MTPADRERARTPRDDLYYFVRKHAIRGQCRCGRCIDGGDKQPPGHTVNLTFFEVAAINDPDPAEFLRLVKAVVPLALDGNEHSYLELGGELGDQGFALTTMGLGYLLGTWDLLSPDLTEPFATYATKEVKMDMAGRGLVEIRYRGDN